MAEQGRLAEWRRAQRAEAEQGVPARAPLSQATGPFSAPIIGGGGSFLSADYHPWGAPQGHYGRFWLLPCTIVKLNRVQRRYEFMIT